MQPYHAKAIVNNEGNIVLSMPFPVGESVDVIAMPADDAREDKEWKELAAREFLRGYSEQDAAYDNYGR
jgi:hypothetical protein